MFGVDVEAVGNAAKAKYNLLKKNPFAYIIASIMAGLYIGFGCMFMGFEGGCLFGLPAQKLVSGIVFSVGLCFVTMGGAELFTGNNLVMALGSMTKQVSWLKTIYLWVICYVGNLIGSVIAAWLFTLTGIPAAGDVGTFFANVAAAKASASFVTLFAKGILCNMLVCIAIWCGTRMKNEAAKVMMNFCCVGCFVTIGFEHSVANMTFLSIGLMNHAALTIGGAAYNLAVVTLGNMVGGIIFMALPYYIISRDKQ